MAQIDVLQRENRDKALKIVVNFIKQVELENIIRKLNGQLRQKDYQVQSLQSLLKERTNKIKKLNTEFFKLQDELIEYRAIKESFSSQQDTIEELKQIIRLQGEEIEGYLKDQDNYVKFVEEMYHSNQGWFEERGLLYEYKAELERQVNQIEDLNENLIQRNEQYKNQLQQQNEQGNDLLGQIEYMIQCREGVE